MNATKMFFIAALTSACVCCSADKIPSRKLLDAIAMVESTRGSRSGNIYQITPEYVSDVNRIQRKNTRLDGRYRRRYSCRDVFDKGLSEQMMNVFWEYYSKRLPIADEEHFAKIHNVGYKGLRKHRRAADIYWNKVKSELNKR